MYFRTPGGRKICPLGSLADSLENCYVLGFLRIEKLFLGKNGDII